MVLSLAIAGHGFEEGEKCTDEEPALPSYLYIIYWKWCQAVPQAPPFALSRH